MNQLVSVICHQYARVVTFKKYFKHFYLVSLFLTALFYKLFQQTNTSVIKLNLADNWIGAEGAGYIAEMLRENCYISDLV